MSHELLSSIIGLVICAGIICLVRKDQLHVRAALRWMLLAIVIAFIGIAPGVIDVIGHAFGVAYPPIIPVLIALGLLLIKVLIADIQLSKARLHSERLVQRIAILESRIAAVEDVKATKS
ncbi:DUF2304 domain-containing protein [Motilimonas pumila]|uniref:DUF2304 domain-containing protein n=1 Tax=Motilimonas pumila TaxID=2303987 RepID=A0A418YDY3_9GAMM|nr:DUF2304 domain-containing protein [Motilimonas pumila]RJG42718.1 DUF2304 domain-containing protein [Motilimonas pumila]